MWSAQELKPEEEAMLEWRSLSFRQKAGSLVVLMLGLLTLPLVALEEGDPPSSAFEALTVCCLLLAIVLNPDFVKRGFRGCLSWKLPVVCKALLGLALAAGVASRLLAHSAAAQ